MQWQARTRCNEFYRLDMQRGFGFDATVLLSLANQPEEITNSSVFKVNKIPAGIKIMEREVNFIVQKLSQQPFKIQVFDAQGSLMTLDLPRDNS